MKIAFLNESYLPLDEVKISPMDRGFLFGEGIYEVICCYDKRLIAWNMHVQRLWNGLAALDIKPTFDAGQLRTWCETLVAKNMSSDACMVNQAIYIHLTRGVEERRFHGWDNSGDSTLFIMSNPLPTVTMPDIETIKPLVVSAETDRRWRNCHIKSTSLLGNVLHFQKARGAGHQEVLLMDDDGCVTEASTSNVFIVKGQKVITPPLSSALLPGITRQLILAILRQHSNLTVIEAPLSFEEVLSADEVWLTSSTKGVVPVVKVNEHTIASGTPGEAWLLASKLYFQYKFDF